MVTADLFLFDSFFFAKSLLHPFLVLGMIACNIRSTVPSCFCSISVGNCGRVFLVLLTITSLVLDVPILVVAIPSFTTGFHNLKMFWT